MYSIQCTLYTINNDKVVYIYIYIYYIYYPIYNTELVHDNINDTSLVYQ